MEILASLLAIYNRIHPYFNEYSYIAILINQIFRHFVVIFLQVMCAFRFAISHSTSLSHNSYITILFKAMLFVCLDPCRYSILYQPPLKIFIIMNFRHRKVEELRTPIDLPFSFTSQSILFHLYWYLFLPYTLPCPHSYMQDYFEENTNCISKR